MIWVAQGQVAARRSRGGGRRGPGARRRRTGAAAAAWVPRRGRGRPGRASASRPAARRPSPPARTRSGSGRSRAAAGCAGRCPWRSGSGPRTGPGGGDAVPGPRAARSGVGGEAGEPVPADVGEPQLGAGVRAFLADDHPHPLRPGGQVQQAGDLGDPRARPDLAAGVIGRFPDPVRELQDGLVHVLGDGDARRSSADGGRGWSATSGSRGCRRRNRCGSAPAAAGGVAAGPAPAGSPRCAHWRCWIRRCPAAARWPVASPPAPAPWSANAARGWNP